MNGYDWIDCGNGRKVYRKIGPHSRGPQSGLPLPSIVRAFSQPVQSMADGKYYDTPRELEATYKASGNPQGKEYECVGDDPLPVFQRPKKDRKAQRAAIERAIEDVKAGNVPPVLTTDNHPI